MYVTANKQMTTDEIRACSLDQLKTIYRQRIEDWILKPMEALAQLPDAGWAILHLFKMIPGRHMSGEIACELWENKNILESECIFLTGEMDRAFTICYFPKRITINPYLIPGWVRSTILEADWLLTDVQAEDLRHLLVIKSMLQEANSDEPMEV
jgi:hypothetical protein